MVGRMKKTGKRQLTPLELEIMQVLWREGASNVQSVQKELAPKTELAYTTVQTMLNVLHRKGRVKRALKGRAYEFVPVVSKEAAHKQAVRDLVERMFGGSHEELVMSLVKMREVDPARLAELAKIAAEEDNGDE